MTTVSLQIAEVMKDEQEKWAWLRQRLVEFTSWGSVLIFVTRKVNSEEVATSLRGEGHKGESCGCGLYLVTTPTFHTL